MEKDLLNESKEETKETNLNDNKENSESKFEKVEKQSKNVKEKIEKMEPPKKKKRAVIICSIIAVLIVLGIIFSTIFALFNINNEKIINGVSISGIDVSKMSKEEAKEKIQNMYEEKKQKDINLKYEDFESTISPLLLEIEYDVNKEGVVVYER